MDGRPLDGNILDSMGATVAGSPRGAEGTRAAAPLGISLLAIGLAACGGAGQASGADDDATSLLVYATVTQDTVDAVVTGFEESHAGTSVEVFRAPTAEVAARIAAERRHGPIRADVLWLTDPLSIEQYAADGLLLEWTPSEIDVIPREYRAPQFFGTRLLSIVIVHGAALTDPPADWGDLAGSVAGGVAIPDPAFAGSAFGALGYFLLSDGYGIEYYQALHDAGTVQVSSPGDVVSGVAEGRYGAGMTLDRNGRDAVEAGSPITVVWPASGAIAIYSPIGVVAAGATATAMEFVDYVLGTEAQVAIAATGWQPIRSDVEWAGGGPQVSVDWAAAAGRQDELLAQYQAIFGR